MRLEEIEIKNLKSITKLRLRFEQNSLGLLYGANGIGKTTALEAISLLGHISCMRRFEVHEGNRVSCRPSRLVEAIRSNETRFDTAGVPSNSVEEDGPVDPLAFKYLKEQLEVRTNRGPHDWFENHHWGDGTPGAVIRYKVHTGMIENDPIEFYVYFNQKIDPFFCIEDFIDIQALLRELKAKRNACSNHLYSSLSSYARRLVDEHDFSAVAARGVKDALCDDFTLVLETHDLQGTEGFKEKVSDLSDEMRVLIESKKKEGQKDGRKLLNRCLLEVAFPRLIQRRFLKELSITQALSRRSSNDVEMNNLFGIVYTSGVESAVNKFIEYVHENSSYFVPIGTHNELVPKKYNPDAEHGLVGFINTDLNDFGRMNDVRESVKDIRSNFAEEIVQRLRLPFGSGAEQDGEFRYEESLNIILRSIIREYRNFNTNSTSPNTSEDLSTFEVKMLRWAADKNELTFVAKRRGKNLPNIDYLSAGENETFFIFLLLLGVPRNSLILLDEPDLHLTAFAKNRFFRNLYSLVAGKECQVIIATHSLFAHPGNMKLRPIELSTHNETIPKRTKFRKMNVDGKVIQVDWKTEELIAGRDTDLAWEFFKHYVGTAWMSFRRIRWRILFQLVVVHAKFLSRELGDDRLYKVIVGLLLSAAGSFLMEFMVGIVAVAQDVWLSSGGEVFAAHKKWAVIATHVTKILVPIFLFTFIALSGMNIAVWRKHRRKRKH